VSWPVRQAEHNLSKRLAVEGALCFIQKLQIAGDRNDVLTVFPFAADFEVAKHLSRNIGFEQLFDRRAEALLGWREVRGLGGDK
jgi:hypothetical protein